MPIYAYQCQRCGETFERLVRADTLVSCPACHSGDLDKLVALTAPQGKSRAIIQRARARAAQEGHLSHYSPSERAKAG